MGKIFIKKETMKVKLNQKLQESDGTDIVVGNRPPMTLKDVIINSLLAGKRDPRTGQIEDVPEKERIQKYDLIRKIRDIKLEVELKSEDVAFIKGLISKHQQSPMILGEALEMIEGKYKPMEIIKDEEETNKP